MILLDGALCATNLFNEYIYISNYLFSAIKSYLLVSICHMITPYNILHAIRLMLHLQKCERLLRSTVH